MHRKYLGSFEELILLTVGACHPDAYAVAVADELARQSGREVHVSAVHKALYRLEEKGMLESSLSHPISRRGGKRRRLFALTAYAKKALSETTELRERLRGQISDWAMD